MTRSTIAEIGWEGGAVLRTDNRVLVAYSTCAEAIMLAPLVMELRRTSWLRPVVAVPGTRSAVLDELHAMFRIEPEVDLDVLGGGVPLEDVIMLALGGQSASFERGSAHLRGLGADVVVVAGDAPVALAVTLTAFHAALPVVHVEDGPQVSVDGFRGEEVREPIGSLIAQVASLRVMDMPAWRTRMAIEELLGISPRAPEVVATAKSDVAECRTTGPDRLALS